MKKHLLVLLLIVCSLSTAMAQSPFRFEIHAGGGMDLQLYRGGGDLNRSRLVLGGACS